MPWDDVENYVHSLMYEFQVDIENGGVSIEPRCRVRPRKGLFVEAKAHRYAQITSSDLGWLNLNGVCLLRHALR